MRYRFVILMLIAVAPLMNVLDALAAPVPEAYAILDIGPPPEVGETMEEHFQSQIYGFLHPRSSKWYDLLEDEAVRNLGSVVAHDGSHQWMSNNLKVTAIPQTHRLRLEFRGGNRTEQVVILNALLQIHLRKRANYRQWREGIQRTAEAYVAQLAPGINPSEALQDSMSKDRVLIAAYKQIAVIRWAR